MTIPLRTQPPGIARMAELDRNLATALRRIWLLGDVHGDLQHIPAQISATVPKDRPAWLIFLGDVERGTEPLRVWSEAMEKRFPGIRLAFIHGNHDTDSDALWRNLHDAGSATALHGRVFDVGGVKIAGLGGVFIGRIWRPPDAPRVDSVNQLVTVPQRRGANANGDTTLRVPPWRLGAIYPDTVAALGEQEADILLTHEAPSCHPYGFVQLDALARAMGVVRVFHGHHHRDSSHTYAQHRDRMGFDVWEVGFRSIRNGLGESVYRHNTTVGST